MTSQSSVIGVSGTDGRGTHTLGTSNPTPEEPEGMIAWRQGFHKATHRALHPDALLADAYNQTFLEDGKHGCGAGAETESAEFAGIILSRSHERLLEKLVKFRNEYAAREFELTAKGSHRPARHLSGTVPERIDGAVEYSLPVCLIWSSYPSEQEVIYENTSRPMRSLDIPLILDALYL